MGSHVILNDSTRCSEPSPLGRPSQGRWTRASRPSTRGPRLGALAALTLGLSTLAACNRSPATGGEARGALHGAASGANVLLITMDTTRMSRLGCYGYQRARTPNLDALAASGVRFTRAYAPAGITRVAHASLFTGVHPPEHGVRDNGRFALGTELPTLAEQFRAQGYRTAAFVSAQVVAKKFGLNRGFDEYSDEMPRDASGQSFFEQPGNVTADRALAWLEQKSAQPFFVWVHFYDPHSAYNPPKELLEALGDPYDGEIAFMDIQIGRLLDSLKQHNQLENTLVVAVADHGEGLGDHGFKWHALLVYDEELRIPLIFSMPGKLPQGTTPHDVVRMVDLMPTLLDLAGLATPPTVTGRTLLPAFEGKALAPRTVYAETLFPYYNFGWAPLYVLIDDPWKVIRGPKPELYQIVEDPGELRNQFVANPAVAQSMLNKLLTTEESMQRREAPDVSLDETDLAALRSLGYVGGGIASDEPPETLDLPNPVEMVPVYEQFRLAESLAAANRYDEAVRLLEAAADQAPNSFSILEFLGIAYKRVGRTDESQQALLSAIALNQAGADTYRTLAGVMAERGSVMGAMKVCAKALELEPDDTNGRELMASLQQVAAQQLATIEQLRIQTSSPDAPADLLLQLAILLSRTGDLPGAIAVLRSALASSPDDVLLNNALAWFLAAGWEDSLRDGAEALRLAQKAAATVDVDLRHHVLHTLAAAQAETGAWPDAIATQRQAIEAARAAGDARAAAKYERELRLLNQRKPLRELP